MKWNIIKSCDEKVKENIEICEMGFRRREFKYKIKLWQYKYLETIIENVSFILK